MITKDPLIYRYPMPSIEMALRVSLQKNLDIKAFDEGGAKEEDSDVFAPPTQPNYP